MWEIILFARKKNLPGTSGWKKFPWVLGPKKDQNTPYIAILACFRPFFWVRVLGSMLGFQHFEQPCDFSHVIKVFTCGKSFYLREKKICPGQVAEKNFRGFCRGKKHQNTLYGCFWLFLAPPACGSLSHSKDWKTSFRMPHVSGGVTCADKNGIPEKNFFAEKLSEIFFGRQPPPNTHSPGT